MRIRKRLPLSSSYNSDLSDAAPPSHQPSNPLKHPSDQTMPLHTKDQQKEFGDETLKSMETNNDIRKIVTSLHPPLSSIQEYKVVPLKKRKGRFDDEAGCSRVNGRGWRCRQPTLVGYSLCQHHLGKRRPTSGGGGGGDSKEEEKPVVNAIANKRKKVSLGGDNASCISFSRPKRIQLKENAEDTWKWKAAPDNLFKTKRAYDILSSPTNPTHSGPATRSLLSRAWSKISPLKTSAMAWRLLQDRLPTRVNLTMRNILPQNCATSCPFCNIESETATHLFLECNVTSNIWYACYNWLGILGVGHNQISSHFLSHSGILLGKKGNIFATSLWICIVWIIWNGRNKLVFEGKNFVLEKALEEKKGRFWSWCTVKYPSFCSFSFSDWLENHRKILEC